MPTYQCKLNQGSAKLWPKHTCLLVHEPGAPNGSKLPAADEKKIVKSRGCQWIPRHIIELFGNARSKVNPPSINSRENKQDCMFKVSRICFPNTFQWQCWGTISIYFHALVEDIGNKNWGMGKERSTKHLSPTYPISSLLLPTWGPDWNHQSLNSLKDRSSQIDCGAITGGHQRKAAAKCHGHRSNHQAASTTSIATLQDQGMCSCLSACDSNSKSTGLNLALERTRIAVNSKLQKAIWDAPTQETHPLHSSAR